MADDVHLYSDHETDKPLCQLHHERVYNSMDEDFMNTEESQFNKGFESQQQEGSYLSTTTQPNFACSACKATTKSTKKSHLNHHVTKATTKTPTTSNVSKERNYNHPVNLLNRKGETTLCNRKGENTLKAKPTLIPQPTLQNQSQLTTRLNNQHVEEPELLPIPTRQVFNNLPGDFSDDESSEGFSTQPQQPA